MNTPRSKVLWTLWMSGGGIAVGLAVFFLTSSVGWTVLAVLGSGVVLNTIGQMITQPVRATRSHRSDQ